jgi:serine protease AprX
MIGHGHVIPKSKTVLRKRGEMSGRIRSVIGIVVLFSLALSSLGPAVAQEGKEAKSQPVLLKLKYATFDPLAGEPAMPASLRLAAYPADGPGAYIVQFAGPIQEAWKDQVRSLGGRVMDYIPDYAFLVWMDGATRAKVEASAHVRWVGLYQPAYKFSPDLNPEKPLFRVILFPGSDLKAIEARLKSLNTPTTQVPGERFTLFLPDRNVAAVAAWPEVLWIEEKPFYELTNDVATGIMGGASAWASGLNGSGMTVTVADTGIDSGADNTGVAGDIHPDFDNRVAHIASWPVQDDGCGGCCFANIGADDGARDLESGHGTHVLGSVAGNGAASSGQIKGLAYQATLTFQALEQYVDFTPSCESSGYTDGYYLVGIPDNLNTLFQQAYNWGSRVHSNSWGSAKNGEYTSDSQAVDQFIWDHPDMIILYSAGNEGVDANGDGYVDEDSLGSPASAKNCITSGASDNERDTGGYNPGGPCATWYECWGPDYPTNPTRDDRISDNRQEMAAFSSRGPTDDGRIKPDVVAPGTNILSTRSQYAAETGWGTYPNSYYMYMGGTSMSNPLIAGAATLVREYFVEKKGVSAPSAALVKAKLINSATDISGYGNPSYEAGQPIPNNHEGWGLVNVGAATSGACAFHDGDTVTTGSNRTYSYPVGSSSQPFKVTLAWSDYPGSLPTGGLVNNLNLVVTAPGGGTVYYGNHFSGGWSVPGGSVESVNNVESVYVQNPTVGTWTVRVDGANVPQGPQPFALVARGGCGAPPTNWVYLPLVLRAYNAPGSVPAAPTLNVISNPDGDGNYTVSWSASTGATSYLLQEDVSATFGSATTAYSGAQTSANISGKPAGTYYYRVNASNVSGTSTWSNVQTVVVSAAGGWTTIVTENFEGSFPGVWDVHDDDSTNGLYYWGKRDCRPYNGSYSGWGVGGGSGAGLSCGSNYPTYVEGWMVYGPFSLAGTLDADLTFRLWLNSELTYDGVFRGASTNGTNYYGWTTSGNTSGWTAKELDLTNVPTLGNLTGQSSVWIALVFVSDNTNTYSEGGYVDDILLRKYVGIQAASPEEAAPAASPDVQEEVMVLTLDR